MIEKEAGFKDLPKWVQKGFRKKVLQEDPLLLKPVRWLANKTFGNERVDNALWKYFQGPIAKADIAVGSGIQRGIDKLRRTGKPGTFWANKVVLPGQKGGITGVEYLIPSALAPVQKASKFILPALGAMKAEELLRGSPTMNQQRTVIQNSDLQKTAEMLLQLKDQKEHFQKEARATELLYKQAEMGQVSFPKTHVEYREKVAQLLEKDLNVMEEAIKMASSTETFNELGGLDSVPVSKNSPQEEFQKMLIS